MLILQIKSIGMKIKALLLPILSIAVHYTLAQDNPKKRLDAVRSLVDSKEFVFDVNRASPLGLPSISVFAIDNYVRVQKDSTQGFLPYFGEIRLGGGYGEGSAIEFDSEIRDYKVKTKRNGKGIIVTFNTKSPHERFDFTLFITKSKSTSVVVKSAHRSSITYYGVIRDLDEGSLE